MSDSTAASPATASATKATPVESLPPASRWRSPQYARLRASLLDAQRRVSALSTSTDPQLLQRCQDCLQRAVASARADSYVAWDCLHQLEQELLATLPPTELSARFLSLRAEAAEKLAGSWRATAVAGLMKGLTEGQPPSLAIVRELHAHLAAAAQYKHHTLNQFERRSLPWVATLLGLALAGVLAYAAGLLLFWSSGGGQEWARMLFLGVASGALGGILSMAFSLGSLDLRAQIPDVHLSGLVALTRPLLGAAVAVPIVVLVQGKFVSLSSGDLDLWKLTATSCFLGGFSERWFLDLMKRVEGDKK